MGHSMGVFYTDSGIIGSWDLEWLQGVLNEGIGLLDRTVLMDNADKSKKIMCQPGMIQSGMSEEVVVRISTGFWY